ncbi:neural cell adhesion molecule L1, partial [Aplysia californica]|uniref:Neural cell adhesion molecule L1 n=1 Tax=Aplysia californica TaxID=6500 RepID=A0ABM1W1D4_APLCA
MTSCGRPYVVFPAAVRSATLALFLGIVLSLTVLDTAHGYRDLEDVTVKEGGKARFLCQTSIHPRHVSGKNFRDRVTVHWTFNGRRLDLDPEEDSGSEEDEEEEEVAEYSSMEKKHYIFKSYQNRHVLLINKARKEDEGEYSCVTTLGDKVDMASGILTVQSPPDPPRNARVINCHGNTAKVSWEPGNENGAKITSYTVQFNLLDKPDDWYDFYESAAGDEREQNVELSPYGTYSFRVVAKNSVGYGRPSVVTRE